MAFIATQTTSLADHGRSIPSRFLAGLGALLVGYAEARADYREIRALEAKSDAELADLGLTRDGIVRHVFAHALYL